MTIKTAGGGMTNSELRSAMRGVKNFLGVIPANENPLPLIKNFPCCFIMNSNPVSARSGHWLAFYIISPTRLEFFDSLAQPLSHYSNLTSYFSRFSSVFANTRFVLQSSESSLCGEFCITFLHLRSNRHIRFTRIISFLFKKSHSRERFVSKYRLLINK